MPTYSLTLRGTNFGFDGTFSSGANTITVCNGVIISVV